VAAGEEIGARHQEAFIMEEVAIAVQERGHWGKVLGNQYLIIVFRLMLAGVFFLSSFGKLVDIERYSVDAVYEFGVLPMFMARPFGLVMPFIELACALGLFFGVLTRLSAFGVSLMSLAFFIVKAIVIFGQGRSINCGCFGAIMDTLASVTIYMDIPMLIMGLVIMAAPQKSRYWASIGKWLPPRWTEKLNLVW
jgi:uncharacterized membrane protein YphA (DoxX/SURF4 family)